MKNTFKIVISLSALLALVACSSMKVEDETERLSGFLPDDFSVNEFLAINPDVAGAQAISAIGVLNAKWKAALVEDSIPADSITAWQNVDKALFIQDSVSFRALYVTYLNGNVTDTLKKNDSTSVLKFNIHGSTAELAFVQSFVQNEINPNSVTETYIIFGQKEGRAYRLCQATDVLDTEKSIDLPGVLNAKTGARDYSCYSFCQQETTVKPAKFYVVDRRCEE